MSYVVNELRRRRSRTLLTALGLASGVGLVMAIVGVSQGLDQAQREVLSPLTSVGTDILVTRTVGATSSAMPSATPSASPTPVAPGGPGGGPRGGFFAAGPGGNALGDLNDEDAAALLNENASVVTDLSKLGEPGTKFTRDFFLPGTLLTFPDSAIDEIEGIDGVTSAVGGLSLLAQHQTGTVPEIVAEVQTGGETLETTVRPEPMTEAEREAVRSCIEKNGGFGGREQPAPAPSPAPSGKPPEGGAVFKLGGFAAIEKCLPTRFQEYNAKVVTPLRTIQQLVNPPETDTTSESYTAAGVDPASPDLGLVTREQLSSGAWLTADDQVLVNASYAGKKSLDTGDTLTINDRKFTVAGIVTPTMTGNTADLYFTLATLQELSSKQDRVNEVLVKAESADAVDEVAAKIRELLPGAQVVTTASLADQVTGSLADAEAVASRLGGALALIVLGAAFVIAVLLTLSSVAKRVREIGTLRAIGWSRGRVVRQVVSETAGIGVLGGLIGIGVGYAVAAAVRTFSPELTATTSGVQLGSSAATLFGRAGNEAVTSVVTLTAPISASTLLLGMACALAGGLVAGAVGGWRASRLAPAVALRDLG
jgi:ABC-type antimicrobial peptide transport system permease subunit